MAALAALAALTIFLDIYSIRVIVLLYIFSKQNVYNNKGDTAINGKVNKNNQKKLGRPGGDLGRPGVDLGRPGGWLPI